MTPVRLGTVTDNNYLFLPITFNHVRYQLVGPFAFY